LDAEFMVNEVGEQPGQGGAAGDHVRVVLILRAGARAIRHSP
jgi:hypothetical protein